MINRQIDYYKSAIFRKYIYEKYRRRLKYFCNKCIKSSNLVFKTIYLHNLSFIRNYKFQAFLLLVIFATLLSFYFYIQQIGFRSLYYEISNQEFIKNHNAYEITQREKPFYIRNIALLMIAIATAIFAWWRNSLNHNTILVNEKFRLDALFKAAVDNLKESNDLLTRQAGVHTLKDLAITSPHHTQKCIDYLCSLNESWMPKYLKEYPEFFKLNKNFSTIKNIEEIKIKVVNNDKRQYEYLNNINQTENTLNNIALSQLVLFSISEIIKHISENVEFKGPYNLKNKYLCFCDLSNINLTKIKNLEGINLQSAELSFSSFQKVNLKGAHLESANMNFVQAESAVFLEAHLENANLNSVNFRSADIRRAHLEGADLSMAHLEFANLSEAHLESAVLRDVICESAIFKLAHLQKADLNMAHFEFANLNEVHLQNAELVRTHFELADLTEAHLEYSNLMGAHFEFADLRNVDFHSANLNGTHFEYSNLQDNISYFANLNNSNIEFPSTKLSEPEGADFSNAQPYSVQIKNTIYNQLKLNSTNYPNTNKDSK